MFYARLSTNGQETNKLYFDRKEFITDTFNPDTKVLFVLDFVVHGKGYQNRKSSVRDIAIEWSNNGDVTGLDMSDLWCLSNWFYKNGKRYGFLEEFSENGLC